MLLKVVLFAYSRGLVSSRRIARACQERFATQARHQGAPDPLYNKAPGKKTLPLVQPSDFTYDEEARTCVCPAGKPLYRKGQNLVTHGFVSEQFRGAKRDCAPCALRAQCLRTPEKTVARQVAFFHGRVGNGSAAVTSRT